LQLALSSLESHPLAKSERRLSVFNSLAELPDRYLFLFENNAKHSFFLSLPWFWNFCETALDSQEKPRIFALENTDPARTPVALLPMRSPSRSSLRFRPRTLCSLTNFYTTHYAPLLNSSADLPSVLHSLALAIRHDSPAWDVIDLQWLDSDSLIFSEFQTAFRDAGMAVQTYFCSGNWYYPVNGRSYGEYLDSLRSSVRNIAKSKNKKIERSGRARVEITTGSEGLESAIESYRRIYASSWKVSEPYPRFIPCFIRSLAKEGWLRLGVVHIDDQPAAAQIWIICNGKASIYKIAYDKRFADLSVGTFLTTRMMERALDIDKVREVDYLSGDDKYKQDWMSHRRERWGIRAMNPRTPRGLLAIARHVGGRAIKRMLMSDRSGRREIR
jgi:hypothetical protein